MSGQAERPADDVGEQSSEHLAEDEASPTGQGSDIGVGVDSDDEFEVLKAKADENWDRYLRAAAELENVRKRAEREVSSARKFAIERFSSDLLEVRDSLEMALAAGPDADAASLREGNEATLKLLTATMQRHGLVEVDPQGEPFDPEMHEAMTMQPSADAEPGSVLTVFQKGYSLNGRLLRPARVVVAAEPEN